jgi:hypothetical protein
MARSRRLTYAVLTGVIMVGFVLLAEAAGKGFEVIRQSQMALRVPKRPQNIISGVVQSLAGRADQEFAG